jgi:hypothetical protein
VILERGGPEFRDSLLDRIRKITNQARYAGQLAIYFDVRCLGALKKSHVQFLDGVDLDRSLQSHQVSIRADA